MSDNKVRDGVWRRGTPLGVVEASVGCGCGRALARCSPNGCEQVQRGSEARRGPAREAVKVWREGLEKLLARVVHLLRDPVKTFGHTQDASRGDARVEKSRHAGKLGTDPRGASAQWAYVQEAQDMLDIIWGMAALRPRIKLAQFVIRCLPAWPRFHQHRQIAQDLMPHWFPLER